MFTLIGILCFISLGQFLVHFYLHCYYNLETCSIIIGTVNPVYKVIDHNFFPKYEIKISRYLVAT